MRLAVCTAVGERERNAAATAEDLLEESASLLPIRVEAHRLPAMS